jgi:aminoglycoside phosphotransferase family enzyme/predicted kinase
VAETHASWVFFVADRVYKVKKPVLFDFIDLRTAEARKRCCEREVELNRRLAPDVYLGVSTVSVPDDAAVYDHMVVMRRLPDHARLATLVAEGKPVEDDLRAIAAAMAAFHAGAEQFSGDAAQDLAGAAELARRWDANLDVLTSYGEHLQGGRAVPRMAELAHRYLAGRVELLDARIEAGRVRDGHGDLLADDIFCLPDAPRLLDCLEFDDRLRRGDVLADMAFLAMDLERLERPDLGELLLADYRELTGDSWPDSLAHHYIAYRALIRAKVAALRAEQTTGVHRWRPVRHLVGIAVDHLEKGAARLVLVGGLPGTGKSSLAQGLADDLGYTVLHSDVVRKERLGLAPDERAPAGLHEGIYAPDVTAATYEALRERARRALAMGRSVIIDATWSSAEERDRARALAAAASAELVELRTTLPTRMAALRIRQRMVDGGDPSDATEEIATKLAPSFDPWPGSTTLTTAGSSRAVLEDALRSLRHAG